MQLNGCNTNPACRSASQTTVTFPGPTFSVGTELKTVTAFHRSPPYHYLLSTLVTIPHISSHSSILGTVLPRLSVPRLSETSIIRMQFRTWSLCKKMVFSLKSQTLRLSRVHVFVCHTYMFNVGAQWYIIVYSVKCKGLQTRPSYIFLCYNSMYIARKVWFRLSEQFHLSEEPIKPLCRKAFG